MIVAMTRSEVFPSQSGIPWYSFQFLPVSWAGTGATFMGLLAINSLIPKCMVFTRYVLSLKVLLGTFIIDASSVIPPETFITPFKVRISDSKIFKNFGLSGLYRKNRHALITGHYCLDQSLIFTSLTTFAGRCIVITY